jgi:hypothetical protein
MKGPAESRQICSVGRRKIAKKIAKNALLCQHLATPLKDAVEGDEGGLGGSLPPWVILGGGGGSSGQLFPSLFFIDFHRTNFSDSAGPLK